MMKRWNKNGAIPEQSSKGVLCALGVAALVPVVGVLWFMSQAMRNEHLAVQQRLTSVYTNQLASVQRRLTSFWHDRLQSIQEVSSASPGEIFATIVRSNLAHSIVLYDEAGRPIYPGYASLASSESAPDPEGWVRARELEFQKQDYPAAAQAYGGIAQQTQDPNQKARALLSQANCLVKASQRDEAVAVLSNLISDPALAAAAGSQNALLVPNAQLRLLNILDDPADSRHQAALQQLITRLNDYRDTNLPALQRRFLMEQVAGLIEAVPGPGEGGFSLREAPSAEGQSQIPNPKSQSAEVFPTLAAERVAADYIESVKSAPESRLLPVPERAGLWHVQLARRPWIVLFTTQQIHAQSTNLIAKEFSGGDAIVEVLAPGQARSQPNPIPLAKAADGLAGWNLALAFPGPDPFGAAAERQAATYRWTGLLVITTFGILAFFIARYITAQMRLAQMKNELVSTVSHELKTPLASMRALVDTLSARRYRDEGQLHDYLQLISKENQRLSHLIENFLTFSRMERGKQRFRSEDVPPGTIVGDAVDALRDKLEASHCHFAAEIEPKLPDVRGDADALTTVLINLLENACKYTEKDKRIQLRAYANGHHVYFEVEDNGIGLNKSEVKRVFDRFYQADQSLTRQRGGCGLGLSIVQHIVQAHGGTVDVASEPGKGSTFTVRLPKGERDAPED